MISATGSLVNPVALRLTTLERGEHHVTIPRHAALRVGTLSGLLGDVAQHFALSREELTEQLFGR